jgi:hypothetical protein
VQPHPAQIVCIGSRGRQSDRFDSLYVYNWLNIAGGVEEPISSTHLFDYIYIKTSHYMINV